MPRPPETPPDVRAPAHARQIAWLWGSTFVASAGRNGYFITCSWALVSSGLGSSTVAVLLAIVSLTELASSVPVGKLVDYTDRRLCNIGSDIARGAALLALSIAIPGSDPFVAINISAIAFSIFDRLSLTAGQASIAAFSTYGSPFRTNGLAFLSSQCWSLVAALLAGPGEHRFNPVPANRSPSSNAERLRCLLPADVFERPSHAFKAANRLLCPRLFAGRHPMLQLDDEDVADLVADHLETEAWLSRRLFGPQNIAGAILEVFDRLEAGGGPAGLAGAPTSLAL
jgi:hypothetical protein